jgi:hypothetical protein
VVAGSPMDRLSSAGDLTSLRRQVACIPWASAWLLWSLRVGQLAELGHRAIGARHVVDCVGASDNADVGSVLTARSLALAALGWVDECSVDCLPDSA